MGDREQGESLGNSGLRVTLRSPGKIGVDFKDRGEEYQMH